MDLTDIGGAAKQDQEAKASLPKRAQFKDARKQSDPDNNKVPQSAAAKDFRKNHWTIDKGIKDGQVKAGVVDDTQREFLKGTEMVD